MVTLVLTALLVFFVLAVVSAASYWIDQTVERHDRSGRR